MMEEQKTDEQKRIEFTVQSLAREEIVAFIDILIRIFERGELKDPLAILNGARNAVVKREFIPLRQLENQIFGEQKGGGE
jgi:hypothetical protein